MKKLIFIFSIIFMLAFDCVSQIVNYPGIQPFYREDGTSVLTPATSPNVASDYGRRECIPCMTKWHNGIDFSMGVGNNDKNWSILSLTEGIVSDINSASGSYKTITVTNAANANLIFTRLWRF